MPLFFLSLPDKTSQAERKGEDELVPHASFVVFVNEPTAARPSTWMVTASDERENDVVDELKPPE